MSDPKWSLGDKFYIVRQGFPECWEITGEPFRYESVEGVQWWYPMTHLVSLHFKGSELLDDHKIGSAIKGGET